MKVLIEDFELIYSKEIIQIKNYPIKVILPDEIEGDFTFLFNFINDTKEKETITNFNVIDNWTLSIDLINFHQNPVIGNLEIIEVGTLAKNQLFLQYRIASLPDAGKTLTLNFYIRKGADNVK